MRELIAALAAAALLGGCAPRIVPHPLPGTVLNPADRSLTAQAKGVSVSARVQDLDVAPNRFDSRIASFYIAVINGTSVPLTLPVDSFVLLDGAGTQYNPLPPSSVQEAAAPDAPALIPYPYVGFYYLEDYEKYGFFNTFTSARPYYAESAPRDVVARALRVENLLPGARAGGEVFFAADPARLGSFELRIWLPSTPRSAPADFVFPFRVEN